MPTRHAIEWKETALLTSVVERTHDAIGAPLHESHPMRRALERRFSMARGSVNGRPFLAQVVDDPTASVKNYWVRGHLTSDNEELAVKRALASVTDGSIHVGADRADVAAAEWALYRRMVEDSQTWLQVDSGLNAAVRRLGAKWDGGIVSWFVMTGVDLAPFEELGCTVRARPEWRRLDGGDRIARGRAVQLGARRLTDGLHIDVGTADAETLRHIREDLGIRLMESLDEYWAWKVTRDINAEPAADEFPEWIPPGAAATVFAP
jgi:hypothetical protein